MRNHDGGYPFTVAAVAAAVGPAVAGGRRAVEQINGRCTLN